MPCFTVFSSGRALAGFLEGYLTAQRIYDHHVNMEAFFAINTSGPSHWLLDQDAWAQEQAATNNTPFWTTLHLILQQHEGLMDGYTLAANRSQQSGENAASLPQLDRVDFLKLSAVGADLDCVNSDKWSMRLGMINAARAERSYSMSAGDLGDLVPALEPKKRVQWETLTPSELEGTLASAGHCSALVKVTGNYSDLFLSHSSWFTYRWAVTWFS